MQCTLIVTTAAKDKANALGEAMGWGPSSYSVPLSASGSEPATHWGLHLAEAPQSFLDLLGAAMGGQMPPDLADAGFPAQDFAAVVSALSAWSNVAWSDALAAAGLVAVEP